MAVYLLDEQLWFPPVEEAIEDGLLAVGGDLGTERLVLAYHSGIFPWFSDDDPILWYAPHERCVIFPDKIKVSKSMKQRMRKNDFTVTMNQAFTDVITSCARINRKDQDGTWITGDMQSAYIHLHGIDVAQSVEVWQQDELVGGLYGIKVNEVFCGESMFSTISNASKIALVWLCKYGNYKLIDCQVPNDHLLSLGAEMISRKEYLEILQAPATKS